MLVKIDLNSISSCKEQMQAFISSANLDYKKQAETYASSIDDLYDMKSSRETVISIKEKDIRDTCAKISEIHSLIRDVDDNIEKTVKIIENLTSQINTLQVKLNDAEESLRKSREALAKAETIESRCNSAYANASSENKSAAESARNNASRDADAARESFKSCEDNVGKIKGAISNLQYKKSKREEQLSAFNHLKSQSHELVSKTKYMNSQCNTQLTQAKAELSVSLSFKSSKTSEIMGILKDSKTNLTEIEAVCTSNKLQCDIAFSMVKAWHTFNGKY